MLKISKKGDYGTIFLTFLAKNDHQQYISLRDVSDSTNIPYKFLSQIALDLKNAGLVESKEGTTGGYKLAKDPQKITMKDVLVTLEGPVTPVACMREKNCRCQEVCMHKPMMHRLSIIIDQTLSKQTLADLVGR